jgi:hypothetical protein
MNRAKCIAALLGTTAALTVLHAQDVLKLGTLYECANNASFKVISCSGAKDSDQCEVQTYSSGKAASHGPAPRQQVTALITICNAFKAAQASAGQFKAGGTALAQVAGAGDWVQVQILDVQGNRYHVRFPDGLTAYTNALRPIQSANGAAKGAPAAANSKASSKAGQPPKPGLVSCAGKIEGRYGPSNGNAGLTIVFRSGKATLTAPFAEPDEAECWTGGGKLYLHKPGESGDMVFDLNDDGTIDSPLGELKKKGN